MTKRNFETASSDRYKLLKAFARENRNNPTDAERALWSQLRGCALGYKFKRQHIIYDYIADFVCLQKKLIVEVDGPYHYEHQQAENDACRTDNLLKYGFTVIRFRNEEVIADIDNIIKTIKQHLYE